MKLWAILVEELFLATYRFIASDEAPEQKSAAEEIYFLIMIEGKTPTEEETFCAHQKIYDLKGELFSPNLAKNFMMPISRYRTHEPSPTHLI